MISIKLPDKMSYTDRRPSKRKEFFEYICSTLPKTKLKPVPAEIIKKFNPNYNEIFRVYDMSGPYIETIKEITPEVIHYAAKHFRGGYRKISLLFFGEEQYIIIQQLGSQSSFYDILHVKSRTRYKVQNLEKIQLLFKILNTPSRKLPLLIGDKSIEEDPKINKIFKDKLANQ